MTITISDVRFAYGRREVLGGVSFEVPTGSFGALLGPNGSGKSTLVKVLAQVHRASSGTIAFDGVDARSLDRRSHARTVAYVPQTGEAPFDLTVREAVLLGRTPHFGLAPRAIDWEHVERAIDLLDLGDLVDRSMSELSGGQAQRALVARAVAQDTPVIVLDEPTSALDLRYQVETLRLVRRLTRDQGVTALIAIHDLNHAARYCDRIVVLHGGRIVADGTPDEALQAETLSDVYGLPIAVERRDGAVEVRPAVDDALEPRG